MGMAPCSGLCRVHIDSLVLCLEDPSELSPSIKCPCIRGSDGGSVEQMDTLSQLSSCFPELLA